MALKMQKARMGYPISLLRNLSLFVSDGGPNAGYYYSA
jgi:hypothetical protein